jgi:hypothetical protein
MKNMEKSMIGTSKSTIISIIISIISITQFTLPLGDSPPVRVTHAGQPRSQTNKDCEIKD